MNRQAMAAAIADFLRAAGLDPAAGELHGTPERVASAWAETFLAGLGAEPAALLGDLPPAEPGAGLVVVTDLTFTSVCPHHLLPYPGRAHLAYLPGERLAGFGDLGRLVRGLAARPILQESLGAEIASALQTHLGARGAACVLDAWPMCVATRGEREAAARVRTVATKGALAESGSTEQRLFLDAVARATVEKTP